MTAATGPSPTTGVGAGPATAAASAPSPATGAGDGADAGRPARARPVDPRLLRYAGAARGFFVASALIGAAQTIVIIAFAWLLTLAIVHVIEGAPAEEIARIAAWLLGTVLARGALLWTAEWASAQASARVSAQLRGALIDAVRVLGPGWLARHNTASLAVTAGHGLAALDAYFGRYLPQLVLTAIATPTILIVMAWQDWLSGLTVALTLPLIPIFMVLIGLATRSVQRTQWQTLHRLAARFSDTVEGLGTLKLYGRERRAVASIVRVTGEYRHETMRVLRVSFLSGFALEFLASIAVALIAVSIGFRLLDGTITLMVGLFVLLLAPEAYLPLRQVGVQFHAAAEGVAATDDIFAVLDAAAARQTEQRRGAGPTGAGPGAALPESALPESALPGAALAGAALPESALSESALSGAGLQGSTATPQAHGARPDGSLVVRELRVRVGDGVVPAAEHPPISFTATPGTITLIEGASGAGKSSLLAALRGVADFEGSATLGAGGEPGADREHSAHGEPGADREPGAAGSAPPLDVRALDAADWLAWAGQRPGLIAGTIAANVTLGEPEPEPDANTEAAPAHIAHALALAQAGHLDPSLALGVQGAGLSGGQAQRVAVARAIHRLLAGPARVLALDEPSSALDATTEAALWAAIRGLADAGATVLLVSHRRSAREIADQIVRVGAPEGGAA